MNGTLDMKEVLSGTEFLERAMGSLPESLSNAEYKLLLFKLACATPATGSVDEVKKKYGDKPPKWGRAAKKYRQEMEAAVAEDADITARYPEVIAAAEKAFDEAKAQHELYRPYYELMEAKAALVAARVPKLADESHEKLIKAMLAPLAEDLPHLRGTFADLFERAFRAFVIECGLQKQFPEV